MASTTSMITPAQADPERALLGCLMHQHTDTARRLLHGLRAEDFSNPAAATVFQLIHDTVTAGIAPTPVVLYDHARETIDQLTVGSGHADLLSRIGQWLLGAYGEVAIACEPHVQWLKAIVCKHAYRRAATAHATRVLQAVEQCSTTELQRIATDTGHLEQLWARYLTALEPDASKAAASHDTEAQPTGWADAA